MVITCVSCFGIPAVRIVPAHLKNIFGKLNNFKNMFKNVLKKVFEKRFYL